MDINLLTGIFCLIATAYIIYLEFKNPMKKRDIFIDIMIGVILVVISLFELYEIDFLKAGFIFWIYIALIILGSFYIVIVALHHHKYLKMNIEEQTEENKESVEEVQ